MQKQSQKKNNRSQIGIVVSDKMNKTAVVKLETLTTHSVYKKIIKHRRKVKAHNPDNTAKIGDKVRIIQTRPLSKEKRHLIVEVIKK